MTWDGPPPQSPPQSPPGSGPAWPTSPAQPPSPAGGSAPSAFVDRDPTSVMGRRIGAWIVDVLAATVVGLALFLPFADVAEVPGGACTPQVDGACFASDGTAYTVSSSSIGVFVLGFVVYLLIAWCLTTATWGASPGKWLFGVRVVGPEGQRPGLGRSVGRTLLWVVDGIGCVIPLVAPIAAFVSSGHRRVGDMVASTYVVDAADTGRAVRTPGVGGVEWQPTSGPSTASSPVTPGQPQWDARRGAYVLWDQASQRWLRHEPATDRWVDL